jgi:hypothetical protein
MTKLDPVETNALRFLASVGEFTLPDDPAGSPKAAAIARVMKSLVRKKCAVIVDVSDDARPLPRWAITDEGRQLVPRAQ